MDYREGYLELLAERSTLKGKNKALLALALRLVETATICRDCEWDVLNHELIQLLTGLESEAKEAIAKAQGGE